MPAAGKHDRSGTEPAVRRDPARQLLLGALAGVAFGFLLQKGGVAKFHVLIGVLLLEDFTVIKVMMSAVLVGMIGVHVLRRFGLAELQYKETRYGASIIGGLIFGVGFGLAAYCPGTGAAALGQGNYDALAVMAGMIIGSWIFAELSGWLGRTVQSWGARGKLVLPELLHMPRAPFIAGFAVVLGAVLVALAVWG